jgi:hypothetical protein
MRTAAEELLGCEVKAVGREVDAAVTAAFRVAISEGRFPDFVPRKTEEIPAAPAE